MAPNSGDPASYFLPLQHWTGPVEQVDLGALGVGAAEAKSAKAAVATMVSLEYISMVKRVTGKERGWFANVQMQEKVKLWDFDGDESIQGPSFIPFCSV